MTPLDWPMAILENHTTEPKITTLSYTQPKL